MGNQCLSLSMCSHTGTSYQWMYSLTNAFGNRPVKILDGRRLNYPSQYLKLTREDRGNCINLHRVVFDGYNAHVRASHPEVQLIIPISRLGGERHTWPVCGGNGKS